MSTAPEKSSLSSSRWILVSLVLAGLLAFSVRGLMGLAQSPGIGHRQDSEDELLRVHKDLSDDLDQLPVASGSNAVAAMQVFCSRYRREASVFTKARQQFPPAGPQLRRAQELITSACQGDSRGLEFRSTVQQALLETQTALVELRGATLSARGQQKFLKLVQWLMLLALSLGGLFYLIWKRWEAGVVMPSVTPLPFINAAPPENLPAGQTMRTAIEASAEGILMVEPEGRIRSANVAAERLLGYARGELAGLEAEQVAPGLMSAPEAHGTWERGTVKNREGVENQRRISWFRRSSVPGAPTVVFVAPVRSAISILPSQTTQQFAPETAPEFDAASLHQLENEILLINGYGEVALANLPPDDPMRADIEQLTRAAARASLLCREASAPPPAQVNLSPLRLNNFITGFERHLRTTLEPGVEVLVRADALAGTVSANGALLEQALLSLLMHALPSVREPRLIRLSTLPGRIEASVHTRGAVNLGWRRTFEERRLPRAAAWLAAQGAMLEQEVAEGGGAIGHRFRIRPIPVAQPAPASMGSPARIDVAS